MTLVQRSLLFSSIERYASLAILFVSTAAMARLLTPREFGVYAVVAAATAVISAPSQEFGGANYLIQKATLNEKSVRSAFTITCSLSWAFAALVYCSAGALGAWFGLTEVSSGLKVAAVGFCVSPFASTQAALLRRDLQFGMLAVSNLVNSVTAVVVSIWLAYRGFSYLSPIWGQIAGTTVQTFVLLMARKDINFIRPSFAECQDVLRFGLYSSGVVIINVIYTTAPQLLLARVLDFNAIGLYTRAVNVTQVFDRIILQAIGPVIMPAFIARKRNGDNLREMYFGACSLLAVLQWPFLLIVAILTEPIIGLWLGPSWLPAAPLVRLYCLASVALFAASLTYPTLVAVERVRDTLFSSLISLPPSLLVIFAASHFGVEAVTASALVTLPFQAAVAISFIARRLCFSFWEFARAMRKSAFVALTTGFAAELASRACEYAHYGPVAVIAASCMLAGATWLTGLVLVNHPLLASLGEVFRGLKIFNPRGLGRQPADQRHV